jgi:hypothetical protein
MDTNTMEQMKEKAIEHVKLMLQDEGMTADGNLQSPPVYPSYGGDSFTTSHDEMMNGLLVRWEQQDSIDGVGLTPSVLVPYAELR